MLELSLPAIDTLFDPEILAAVVFLSSFGIFGAFNDRDPAKSRGLTDLLLQAIGRSWSETALVASVLVFTIGMMGMVRNMSDGSGVYDSVKIALLAFAYGGVLAGFGFCIYRPNMQIKHPIKIWQLLTGIVILIFITSDLIQSTGTPLDNFLSQGGLLIYSFLFAISLVFGSFHGSKPKLIAANDANLCAGLGGMALGLVLWFVDGASYIDSRGSIYLISNILFLSCVSYLLIYLWSLFRPAINELNLKTKTWHIAEAASFFIFLVYAPVGATEYFRESTDQANQQANNEAQQLEINQLKAQIKLLTEKIGEV